MMGIQQAIEELFKETEELANRVRILEKVVFWSAVFNILGLIASASFLAWRMF